MLCDCGSCRGYTGLCGFAICRVILCCVTVVDEGKFLFCGCVICGVITCCVAVVVFGDFTVYLAVVVVCLYCVERLW